MPIKSINPKNNKLIKEYKELSPKEVKAIIRDTDKAHKSWKNTSFEERSNLLKKAGEILKKNSEKYAEIMANEMGKPITQGIAEAKKCALVCDYYADNAQEQLKDEIIQTDASKSYVRYQPLGTIFAIMPWNFPFWQVWRFIAPALMAGNTGVLKHASNVPGCALEIEKIINEAEFPDNVFKTLLISSKLADKVTSNKYIKAVTLTGSSQAGSKVAARAGKYLKKVVLELGGSDPFIVLDDVNLDEATKGGVLGRLLNSGQSCIAAKRFIVHESIADEFERRLAENFQKQIVGDPLDKETQVGPLARQDLVDTLEKQVQVSIKRGAIALAGGKKKSPGAFFEPTVLTKVVKGMPAYDEETFGPVAAIIRFKTEKQAIKIANDTEYGLGGSIWTSNSEKGEQITKQIDSGATFVNGITKSDVRLPFGGTKNSGYGRELGSFGIKEFVNIKTVWIK